MVGKAEAGSKSGVVGSSRLNAVAKEKNCASESVRDGKRKIELLSAPTKPGRLICCADKGTQRLTNPAMVAATVPFELHVPILIQQSSGQKVACASEISRRETPDKSPDQQSFYRRKQRKQSGLALTASVRSMFLLHSLSVGSCSVVAILWQKFDDHCPGCHSPAFRKWTHE
jgi:hypothetical protein